jgi:copper chaperone CopZ
MKSAYCFAMFMAFLLIMGIQQSSFAQNASASEKTITIKVSGITCAHDLDIIKKNVERKKGVAACNKVGSAAATSTFEVKYNPLTVSVDTIYRAVEESPSCDYPDQHPYKVKK